MTARRLPPLRALHELWIEPQRRVVLRGGLLRPYRRWAFAEFGPNSVLHKPAWIYGPGKVSVGGAVLALHGLWLSAERPTWGRAGHAIEIGDRVGIRPYCTISAAESISIDDDVIISSFTSIIDSDHTFGESGNVITQPLETAPVRIGAGTWIGERVAILKGSTIGKQCAIGANSVVRGEIPDYSVAVGAPARVVGTTRAGRDHPVDRG